MARLYQPAGPGPARAAGRLAGDPGTGLRGGPQAATDLSVTSHPGGPGAAAAVGLGVDPGLSGRHAGTIIMKT